MDRQPRNNGRSGKPPAFLFYAADWLSDLHVRRMAPAQRGLYIDLLALCWREGFVPDDPDGLGRALGYSAEEMAVAWPGVRARFRRRRSGELVNPRLERERSIAFTMHEKRVEAAKVGGRISAQKRSLPTIGSTDRAPPVNLASASASASALPSVPELEFLGDLDPSSQARALPDSKSGRARTKRKRSKQPEPEGFAEFYAAFPIHVARIDAAKAFREKIDDGAIPPHPDLLAAVVSYARWLQLPDAPNPCYPATWLRGERWTDEHARLKSGLVPIVDLRKAFLNPNGGTNE